MKKILIPIFVVCLALSFGKAGAQMRDWDDDIIKNIKANPVYVVMSGNSKLDAALIKAMNDSWKMSSEIKQIDEKDLKKYLGNDKNYFIALVQHDGKTNLGNYRVTFFNGKSKRIETDLLLNTIDDKKVAVGKVPPSAYKEDPNYVMILDYAVNYINDRLVSLINNKINLHTFSDHARKALAKGLPNFAPQMLKNKTLIIYKDELWKTEIKGVAAYKYKYLLLSYEEYARIISTPAEENENKYCFYSSGDIFDIATHNLIYQVIDLNNKTVLELNDCIDGNCP